MKKLFLFLLIALVFIFTFVSCNNDTNQQLGDKDNSTVNQQIDNTPEETDGCNHSFGEWNVVKAATCIEEGKSTRFCSICSETEEIVVEKNDVHTVVINAAVAATCKNTGLTEGSYCSACKKILVEQTIIPITSNHTPVTDPAVSATCNKTGLTEGSHCAVCNQVLTSQNLVSVIDHIYVNEKCTMCGKNKPYTFVPDCTAAQANTIGNKVANSRYASQGNWIYFSPHGNHLCKIKNNSNTVITLYVTTGNVGHINVVGDWIYFYVEGSKESDCYMAKIKTDGTAFEKIISSIFIGEMLVVKDKIFFTTFKNPYSNYSKEWYSLYSVSVNGGMAKQVHDGSVSSLVADSQYVFFRYRTSDRKIYIYRIKYDGSGKTLLLSNYKINYISLYKSRLYFLQISEYQFEDCIVGSVSINGGSVTTHGTIPYYSDWVYVTGNSLYYWGSRNWDELEEGVIEFNLSTKQYSIIHEGSYFSDPCYFTGQTLIIEKIDESGYILNKILIYDTQKRSWKEIKFK